MSEQEDFKALLDKCESPIEHQLACCLATLLLSDPRVKIVPQYRLGKYRFDFAINDVLSGEALVLVECDGKEFHSKPEDIENDRRKTHLAAQNGLEVLRFPGREIYLYPMRAAECVVYRTALAMRRRWGACA